MPQKTTKDRLYGLAAVVLLVLAGLAMAKTLFVGLEIDEEYALSIGYRLVKGDRLFESMWEPHQLSALPAAVLVALFMAVTGGTTGVIFFARAVVLLCKAAMSTVFYREFRGSLGRRASFLAALVLFLYTPKWFLGPDYVSQQFHFTVAAFLCFHHYYTRGFRRPWLMVPGAVCACLSFLAFPQSIVSAAALFLGMMILGRRRGEPKLLGLPRGAVLFVLGCAGCAAAFLAWVLPGMGVGMLLERVSLILNDPQYGFSTAERMASLAAQALDVAKFLAKPLALAAVLALVWWLRDRRRDWTGRLLELWCVCSMAECIFCMLRDSSVDVRQFLPIVVLAGAWAFRGSRGTAREPLFWLGFLPGIVAYLFILRSTLLGLAPTFMYLTWPALCGLMAVADREAHAGPEQDAGGTGTAALLFWIVFLLATRFWCVLITGWQPASIRDTELKRITTGPAAGIWADVTMADTQEALARALEPYAGQQLLQAIGLMHGSAFMMDEGTLTVGQATVISGTDSDPRLIRYYEELPEKIPDVILYDDNEVRDMAAFHAWIEENIPIADRYTVTYGTASLQVLVVDKGQENVYNINRN